VVRLDVLPLCPARRDLDAGDVADDDRREEAGVAGLGACMEASLPVGLGRLRCVLGHVWTTVRHADLRKVADPVGALWRDADAHVRASRWRPAR
jgi:hypothetical protein